MRGGPNWNRNAQVIVALLAALALKLYYSTAGAGELRWILAPPTCLVELITGERFAFEAHVGYMSSDHSFLIAASCAGVNFLVISFLMLALGKLLRGRSRGIGWSILPVAALAAYGATIIANTIRICTALWLRQVSSGETWLTPAQLHRVEGIVIYFGCLLLLFFASERPAENNAESSAFRLLRRVWAPLAIYYAITLGAPLAGGRFGSGPGFGEHAFFVLITPVLLIILLAGIFLILDRCRMKPVR